MSSGWRYHTVNCVKEWVWYPVLGKAEHVIRAAAPSCVKAGVLAIPLALPGAAFVPAVAGGPGFVAPYVTGAVPGGAGFGGAGAYFPSDAGGYGSREGGAPLTGSAYSPALPGAALTSPIGYASPMQWGTPTPLQYPLPSVANTPPELPAPPATSVPEPSSLILLFVAVAVFWLMCA